MLCSQCDGPIEPLSLKTSTRCDCCDARQVLVDDGVGLGGVILLGGPTDVDCPNCGDQLVSAVLEESTCQTCPSCFGVAFETAGFSQLIRERRPRMSDSPILAAPLLHPKQELSRECPVCRESMEVHPYHGPGGSIIETCAQCRLVWVDSGEALSTTPVLFAGSSSYSN